MTTSAAILSGISLHWTGCLWRATWQGSIAFLVVWLISGLLPRMPARFQCWLWRLVLLKFLAVLLWTIPIALPLLPAAAQHRVESEVVAETKLRTMTRWDFGSAIPGLESSDRARPVLAARLPMLLTGLLAAWGIGIAWQGNRLIRGGLAVRQFRRRCRPMAGEGLAKHLDALCHAYAIRRQPLLLEHEGGGSPMLLGILRPAIIVPTGLVARLGLTECRMVLEHELAHIKRRDLAWSLVAALVRTVFFFHPLVWWASRRLELAQEIAADQLVLTIFREEIGVYAKMLLAVASQPQPIGLVPSLSVGTVGHYETLKRRLIAMKSFHFAPRSVVAASALLVGLIAVVGIVPWRLVAAESPLHAANDPAGRNLAAKLSPAERRMIEILQQPTTMKSVERPLKDVLASLGKRHKVSIALDKKQLADAGISDDVLMTREMTGISLHSALRLFLADLGLTCVVRGEVLWITSPEEAQRLVRLRKAAIDPSEYWRSSQVAATSRKKVAEALKKPVDVRFVGSHLWDVIPSLRKVAGVEIQPDVRALDHLWESTQITLELKDVPLESVLSQLARKAGLRYVVDDDFILITSPKEQKP